MVTAAILVTGAGGAAGRLGAGPARLARCAPYRHAARHGADLDRAAVVLATLAGRG
ncbi:MAG: hypothetical protein WDN49_22925 [Acetobacteraceae bacterium]